MTASLILMGLMLYHALSLLKVTLHKARIVLPSPAEIMTGKDEPPVLTEDQKTEVKGLTKEYFIHMIGACIYSGTIFMAYVGLFKGSIRVDEPNYVPIYFLIAGFYCCVTIVFANSFITQNKLSNIGFLAVAFSGCYLVLSVVDHYSFFYSEEDKAGVAYLEAINSADLAAKVTDVQCDTILFVRDEGEAIRWRCPSWFYGNAMIKWPFAGLWSYKEGESRELKMALEEIKSIAKKPPSYQ